MCEITTPTVREEIDRIHSANVEYWKQGDEPDREARAEHHRRQHRLDEIRADRVVCELGARLIARSKRGGIICLPAAWPLGLSLSRRTCR
jgi:hypothetical protein